MMSIEDSKLIHLNEKLFGWCCRINKVPTITKVIKIPVKPVTTCDNEMLDHNEPLVTASSSANNIKPILNKLDPSRFATAISGLPNRKAAIVVANSGNEVLIAKNWVPTKLSSHCRASASLSPTSDNHIEVPIMQRADIR